MTVEQLPPGDCDPNWRDNPADLNRLCDLGAETLHGPRVVARTIETINPQEDYL